MTIEKGIIIRNIYYMLTYAFTDLRRNNYEDIAGEFFDNIFDLFAEILNKGVSYQLKRGLHREYVSKSEPLTTIKGKISVQKSIRLRLQQKIMLECEYDEFSEDNIYNRIIKATLKLLIKAEDVHTKRKDALRKLLLFFSNVSICDLKTIRWHDIKYDRNSSTYRMIHNLCYFIVKALLLTTEEGPYKMQHFDEKLISHLFEKFVLNYYRKHYPMYGVSASKVEWNIDEDESSLSIIPDMQTDITIRFPKRILIIDTKYYGQSMKKNMGKNTISSNNIYQITSYVMNEDKYHSGNVDGMLLYAKTQEEICPEGKMVMRDGNVIYFRYLDLSQDFGGIKHQLDEFIRPYL